MHDEELAIPLQAGRELDALRERSFVVSVDEALARFDQLNKATPRVYGGLAERRMVDVGMKL